MADDARIDVPISLVRALVDSQFPQWSNLPLRPVAQQGWDNKTFRLGDRLKVRLPTAAGYAAQAEKEFHCLPALAHHLPLPIPAPLALGHPGHGFGWPWLVLDWLDGEPLTLVQPRPSQMRLAHDLALFLNALRGADTGNGLPAGPHNFHRGGALAHYDGETRECVDALGGRIDGARALTVWEEALSSHWPHPPVWVHGDIAVGNLLVSEGRLAGVIDFGSCAVGDPACDLVIAWTWFEEDAGAAFRSAMGLDENSWARARGWALWKALLVEARGGAAHASEVPPFEVIERVTRA